MIIILDAMFQVQVGWPANFHAAAHVYLWIWCTWNMHFPQSCHRWAWNEEAMESLNLPKIIMANFFSMQMHAVWRPAIKCALLYVYDTTSCIIIYYHRAQNHLLLPIIIVYLIMLWLISIIINWCIYERLRIKTISYFDAAEKDDSKMPSGKM